MRRFNLCEVKTSTTTLVNLKKETILYFTCFVLRQHSVCVTVTATEPVKSPEGGLGLLAEYAEKSREDAKKKRSAEEGK